MIDPNAVSTIRVGELSPEPFSLTDNVPHEVGTELKRGTIEDLATFISAFIGSTDGVGFRAISVTDGQTLPTTTQQEFILVGKGTYYNVVGGSTIICTEELNAIVSNGSYWFIGVEIPINVELAGITQFIRDGFINTTPSEDAVYEALVLKANIADSENIANKQNDLTPDGTGTKYPTVDAVNTKVSNIDNTSDANKPVSTATQTALNLKENTANKNVANGYAGLGADGKLISSQLPSITISDTFVVGTQDAMLALVAETGDVAVRTDLNKSYILKGTDPTLLADWQELLTPTSAVTTVFGRAGAITAQTGDYTTAQVTETTNKKYQTDVQALYNDATSSIQTQLNGKQPSGSYATGTGTANGTNTGDNAVNTLYSGLVSNATHTGDATGATALTVKGINGTLLSSLATGILKNTTTTGVPSIAVAADFPTLNQNTTGTASNITGVYGGSITSSQVTTGLGFTPQAALTNPITGTGTTGYLPKFTSAGVIGNSIMSESGTTISIEGISPTLRLNDSTNSGAVVDLKAVADGTDVAHMALFTRNTGTPTEKMRILANGNVLIGTTTDIDGVTKLQVNGSGYFASSITANGNSVINGVAGGDVLYLQKATGANLALSGATGTTNKISLQASNTTNPNLDIYVGGSIRQSISNSGVVNITNLSGDGTRTVVADASGNLSTSAPIDSRPYKVYTALLSQSGTNAPTAIVLENTLGGIITWARGAIGVYTGTLTGVFTTNKTAILISAIGNHLASSNWSSVNEITVRTYDTAGGSSDNRLFDNTIEIRVYN